MRPSKVLVVAAALVWLVAGYPVVGSGARAAPLLGWVAFAVAFAGHAVCHGRSAGLLWLALQTLAGVALGATTASFRSGAILLIIVAAQLPVRLTTRWSTAWIVAQTVLLFGTLGGSLVGLTTLAASQLFAAGTAALAESERTARAELLSAHVRLERLEELRLQAARQAERLRIARDLHDGLGHRLTALGLLLEAARHLDGSPTVRARLVEGRDLVHKLTHELRSTVGEMRGSEASELKLLLEGLGHALPRPSLEVSVDDSLRVENADTATELYRICQEVVTNAARHSSGHRIRLDLRASGGEVVLEGRDDGAPATDIVPGHGIQGIQERARALGGSASFEAGPAGFSVVVRFPEARLR